MAYTISDFKVGQRVELHPATDRWMRGDRFGEITLVGPEVVYILMDKSGRTQRFYPHNVGEILA